MLSTSRDTDAYTCTDTGIVDAAISSLATNGGDLYDISRQAIINDQWAAVKCSRLVDDLGACSAEESDAQREANGENSAVGDAIGLFL